jgi:penicillin amidase
LVTFLIFLIILNNFSKRGLPQIKGEIKNLNLKSEVKILRDKYGIPHIYAKNLSDLFYAIGFVHAQDRLWQMDLFRRISQGRLTEIFGDLKITSGGRENLSLLSQDKFYRILGFKYYSEKSYKDLSSEVKFFLERYCEGINDYIEKSNNLPLEFFLLKYKPEKWTPVDTLSIGRFIAWELTSNWETELLRYLTALKIGEEKMWRLFPKIDSPGPYIVKNTGKNFSNSLFLKKVLELYSATKFIYPASNNWVVSGKKSVSKKPILANDPHLTHMLPSIFYLIHLVCNDINVIGVSFPGLPFVVLGHNKDFAWGATTTNADTSDIFIEKINPENKSQYLYKGRFKNFEKRREKIRVKNGRKFKIIDFEILSTVHGPVINSVYPEFLKDSPVLSICWSGFSAKVDGKIYLKFAKAKNMKDFISAVKENEIPIQNWVFADREGNIGYFPGGLIPLRKKGDGTYPVSGETGEYDWRGFIKKEEIPQIYNPEENYIVTANNKVIDEKKYKYIISYDYPPSYRADRITQLINSKEELSVSDMKKFQMDTYSKQGERIAKYFIKVCEKIDDKEKIYKDACNFLKNWNFSTDVNSIGATIFYKTYDFAFKNTLEDELGEELLKLYVNNTRFENIFDRLLEIKDEEFFDNIKTKKIETKEEIILKSFKQSVDFLSEEFGKDFKKWRWGNIHKITISHPFSNIKILKPFFSAGPFETSGGRNIINVAYYTPLEKYYNVVHGAVFRMIVDMANIENSQMIIDTGQSGHFRSKHFKDQFPLWLKGETIPMFMEEEKIRENLEGELILNP